MPTLGRYQGKHLLIAIAVVLAVAGGLVLVLVPRQHTPPSLPVKAASVAPPASPSLTVPPSAVAIPYSVPVTISVPAIGVNARVEPVGLCPAAGYDCDGAQAGALATPPLNAQNLTGWWEHGYAPGQAGPAVIVGHVNSAAMGNLVFANLTQMKSGEQAIVTLKDGQVVRFTAYATQEVSKTAFPTARVYGATGSPELRLITCGGAFNSQTGHYDDNFIVYLKMAQ